MDDVGGDALGSAVGSVDEAGWGTNVGRPDSRKWAAAGEDQVYTLENAGHDIGSAARLIGEICFSRGMFASGLNDIEFLLAGNGNKEEGREQGKAKKNTFVRKHRR